MSALAPSFTFVFHVFPYVCMFCIFRILVSFRRLISSVGRAGKQGRAGRRGSGERKKIGDYVIAGGSNRKRTQAGIVPISSRLSPRPSCRHFLKASNSMPLNEAGLRDTVFPLRFRSESANGSEPQLTSVSVIVMEAK